MFTTFSASTESDSARKQQNPATPDLPKPPRPKRHQVSRACVWCRTYRIKCDANYPCNNCLLKGRKCTSDKGKDDVRTFPLAIKEIERLKGRIKELEDQLKDHNIDSTRASQVDAVSDVKLGGLSLPLNLDPLEEHGGNKKYYNWDFVSTRTAMANQQTYGASSSFYFIGQITAYLDAALQQHHSDIQLTSASRRFASPISASKNDTLKNFLKQSYPFMGHNLSRSQEEYFLDLYWQSYHLIYPIVDEAEFRAHYNSLWETSETSRKPSGLVDIMLAICMQYGAALTPPYLINLETEDSSIGDATIAGRWFYLRTQSLLTDELEGPSIRTFQCHLLSIIWLSNASFQNMAHSVMAMGIRSGVILGLHQEPSDDLPETMREFRKRLWWTLYAMEMNLGMALGRPLALSIGQVNCSIPDDRPEANSHRRSSANPTLAPAPTSFNTHCIKLTLATRAAYITFYEKCAEVLGKSGHKNLYQDPEGLEACAKFLLSKISYLQTWLQQVPNTLKTKRKNNGQIFSTDLSSLEIDPSAHSWLSRQRVWIELLYHDFSMSLYRPFISFHRYPNSNTPVTEAHAISCVRHAMAITTTIHQILTETDLLSGWHEPFQWQWNATLTLIGYILAYPMGPSTVTARKSLSTAITAFELLASNFVSAGSAANVARDLAAKADLLLSRFQSALNFDNPPSAAPLSSSLGFLPHDVEAEGHKLDSGDPSSNLLTNLSQDELTMFQNTLSSTSGFAFDFNAFDGLGEADFDGSNVFDFLAFAEEENGEL